MCDNLRNDESQTYVGFIFNEAGDRNGCGSTVGQKEQPRYLATGQRRIQFNTVGLNFVEVLETCPLSKVVNSVISLEMLHLSSHDSTHGTTIACLLLSTRMLFSFGIAINRR